MAQATKKPPPATDPAVRVTVGGRERDLRFGMWACYQMEQETGRPWHDVVREIRADFVRSNVLLLWACLQHEANPPTLREVADSLPMDGSAQPAFQAAFQVMLDSLPKVEANEKGPLEDEADAA